MKRKAYDRILEWKVKFANKYALMLDGPRRVGKKFQTYADMPTLLDKKDYRMDRAVAHFPLYATPALLEQV